MDDCTRFTWVYLLKIKSEIAEVVQVFFTMLKNPIGEKILITNAKHHFNTQRAVFFDQNGFVHVILCQYASIEWNGKEKERPCTRYNLSFLNAQFAS